ncbi:MAG: class I SAM-dependent methyltransferase, partial [Bacteroidia bacterium]
RSLAKKLPLYYYTDKNFYIIRNDALDRFGTPLEQRFSKTEIATMLRSAGLGNITFSNQQPYWHAVGQKL